MTAHTCRYKRPAKGARTGNMVRIMASITPEDMRRLTWLANKRQVPVAKLIRDAVWAYLLPIAADADAEENWQSAGDAVQPVVSKIKRAA
ncbi:MAG: hypothetical protein JSR91_00305 [Proteobacteria bacterium]|nr:hypothetical protein [Pseudomonadota bacterium]